MERKLFYTLWDPREQAEEPVFSFPAHIESRVLVFNYLLKQNGLLSNFLNVGSYLGRDVVHATRSIGNGT